MLNLTPRQPPRRLNGRVGNLLRGDTTVLIVTQRQHRGDDTAVSASKRYYYLAVSIAMLSDSHRVDDAAVSASKRIFF